VDKRKAIEIAKKYSDLLKEHFLVETVYLFGSYAKNTNHEDSDIDVAIIVDKIEGDFFSTQPLLWKLRRQIDDRIEPILFSKDSDSSGFLSEIKRTGIQIC
jgi:predicted nucleotidyltransferase